MADLKNHTIRIRMYRVGFGDCFLVSLPSGEGHAHILVDCGVHSKGDIGTIEEAVSNACSEAGNEFAIVIATHAHQDHISGFGKCDAQFKKCKIGEVWLPWTENPRDRTATRLKNKRLALAGQLQQHFAASPPSEGAMAAVANIAGNEKSLQLLKSGINNGLVQYLEAGAERKDAGAIPGLLVRVLGPPRDKQFLARMDPPKGERFLRLDANGTGRPANGVRPFLKSWTFRPARRREYPAISDKDRKTLTALAGDPEGLAFALDQAVNNTSVVSLISYRGRHLLFPGDAQYGNWNYWLEQTGSEDLLAEVNFYKVAHHGSFNATPRKALEGMTQGGFAAMVSTQGIPWPSIPLGKLVDAVEKKASGFVRSDSIPVRNAPKGPAMKRLPHGFTQQNFWFDYEIPLA